MVNPAISNLVIMLGLTQLSKKIPFEDENVLNIARGIYILSNVIIFGLYLYTKSIINKKNDLTTLKYVQPANAFQQQEEKLVTTTIKEYDLQQVQSAIRSVFSGMAMVAFMHIYMKYTNPLVIQAILPLKSAFEQNIVKIHVFGKPAIGDLKRPFKTASLFGAAQGEAKVDKKAVSAAETAGASGVKED
ncbi:uncharacterized protein SAPINGB_P005645 [Magnusiomyces paraingens]|uniref:Inorganic phosphate transport PHO88 n=1 Tax=Magnusiomyces paraingens TaxID=2606893 RepID=A0A5E8C092_9ASCO|nr:uncharacterized protein SAPINGB_P005645 [Saprochaete ingens]VVT57289.1 unnamed protein product [Saprochaete ingens]